MKIHSERVLLVIEFVASELARMGRRGLLLATEHGEPESVFDIFQRGCEVAGLAPEVYVEAIATDPDLARRERQAISVALWACPNTNTRERQSGTMMVGVRYGEAGQGGLK